eukprot:scaffold7241_cov90-Isochrysis_galbana.AAC.1
MGRGRGSVRTARDSGCPAESPLNGDEEPRMRHHQGSDQPAVRPKMLDRKSHQPKKKSTATPAVTLRRSCAGWPPLDLTLIAEGIGEVFETNLDVLCRGVDAYYNVEEVDGKEFVLASELAALADDVVNRAENSVDLEEELAWPIEAKGGAHDRDDVKVPHELLAGRVDEPVGGVDLAFFAVSLYHLEADSFARVVEMGQVDPVGDGFVVNFDHE